MRPYHDAGPIVLQAVHAGADTSDIRKAALSEIGALTRLRIIAIFTTARGTQASLSVAAVMAVGLAPEICLIAPQIVPDPLDLHRPPVLPAITFRKLARLTASLGTDVRMYVFLSRNPLHGLLCIMQEQVPVACSVRMPPFTLMPRLGSGSIAGALRQAGRNVLEAPDR